MFKMKNKRALTQTSCPLGSVGWLIYIQPCQEKTNLCVAQWGEMIWRGLQPQLWHGNGIGHGVATSMFSIEGGGVNRGNWGLDLSHRMGAVPLLGHFTGAGTWVGCCVLGEASETDFLLTWQVDEGKGLEEDDLLDIKVKSKSEDLMVIQ